MLLHRNCYLELDAQSFKGIREGQSAKLTRQALETCKSSQTRQASVTHVHYVWNCRRLQRGTYEAGSHKLTPMQCTGRLKQSWSSGLETQGRRI